MNWLSAALAAVFLLITAGVAAAEPRVSTFTLANGLQVVVIPDHRAPIITHMIWYRTGAADDPWGTSGIAHFLEHLMFKSTGKLKSGEFTRTITGLGGRDNAKTTHDTTYYYQRVAKEHLRAVMALEADRMVNLRLVQDEVRVERDVIQEERRSVVDNNPLTVLTEQMLAALYHNHPYGRPVLGWAHEMAKFLDARAFVRLMKWLREYDSDEHTVVMVQVENEIGMIPEPRDHSNQSEQAYQGEVPEKLLELAAKRELGPEINALWEQAGRKTRGTWSEVFGSEPEGEEVFTAWQFANYVEKIAAAGKREYPLPMFANAALIRPGYRPAQYPSGGPLPHLMEIWRAGALSLDMICPDIYFANFMEWCGRYVRNENPLFIPEMAPSTRASANAAYAIAHFGAIGVGPFSIENVSEEKARLITGCYGLLSGMSELILKAQQDGTIAGLSPQVDFDWKTDPQPSAANWAA